VKRKCLIFNCCDLSWSFRKQSKSILTTKMRFIAESWKDRIHHCIIDVASDRIRSEVFISFVVMSTTSII
jgi:hypothetical protein